MFMQYIALLLQVVQPERIAGNSPVLWALLAGILALAAVVTALWVIIRNDLKATKTELSTLRTSYDQFVRDSSKKYEDLLRETLSAFNEVSKHVQVVASEIPHMSHGIRDKIEESSQSLHGHVTAQAQRIIDKLPNA